MRVLTSLGVAAVTLAALATLTPTAPARAAETVLQLSQSVTIAVPPDELVVMLRIEVQAANPADAQSRLNTAARAAVTEMEKAEGVRVATMGYQVNRLPGPSGDRGGAWRATQTFRLSGQDGGAVLGLIGAMQQKGLSVTAMQWRMTPDTERKARQQVTREVLQSLRGRASDAADLLGMNFSHFRTIQLDGEDSANAQPRAAMMGRAAEAPGPVAPQEDILLTATAQVEAVLVGR